MLQRIQNWLNQLSKQVKGLGPPPRIYIAGPMTGYRDKNFAMFNQVAEHLEAAGWKAINPARLFGARPDLPRSSYMRGGIYWLSQCDAVAMLPGWSRSPGAKLEHDIAQAMGMMIVDLDGCIDPVVQYEGPPAPTETILQEAERITTRVRQRDYGHPREDFAKVGLMWTGVLSSKLKPGAQITAADVPLCMICVKVARQAHRPKRDNAVDIAGYARTAAVIAGEED